MRRSPLADRIDRIATVRHTRQLWDAATVIAVRYDLTPQEVIDEADRLHAEAHRRGITLVEIVASEWRMSLDDVIADLAQHESSIGIDP